MKKYYVGSFRRNLLLMIVISGFFISQIYAQDENVGLLYHDEMVSSGYVLFTPAKSKNAFLINECGEKVNEWEFSERPGATCYLLENGNLLRAGKDSLEIRDWENNLVWSYATSDNGINQHHDIEPLPNGNILCVVGENYDSAYMVELGKNPETLGSTFRMDKIVELQPGEMGEAEIVWEWKFIDHIIQDFDEAKPNYGVVAEHPELLNLNYINGDPTDFTHVNAVDYNAELDQIMISPRHLNEILIIDHSTTTEEAASHSGGNSGKGGDFLWRWGNIAGYDQGSEEDMQLIMQHDCKWVDSDYADGGKISVFSNGNDENPMSRLCLLDPVFEDGMYKMENNVFLPLDYEWSWQGKILNDTVYEKSRSGMMFLENGNAFFCETSKGRFSEITKSGEHLWTYVNPVGTSVFNQFDDLPINENPAFRAEKYPVDYPGFDGKDLEPLGLIEDINQNSENCKLIQSIEEASKASIGINNPIYNQQINFTRELTEAQVYIYNLQGKVIWSMSNFSGEDIQITIPDGVYIILINEFDQSYKEKLVVVKP